MESGKDITQLMNQAQLMLQNVFGHSSFRGDQEAVLRQTLEGRPSLVLMPTGMGKSLCFQIPARLLTGLTLVISPLIALMKDQVDAALRKGFRTCFINSSLSTGEREDRYRRLARGEYELVYVTPERFRSETFMEALDKNRIALLAIDEAHCISAWGHDFRPDYSRLGEIRGRLGSPLTMALTATATPEVQKDILGQLGLEGSDVTIFNHGMERPNLRLGVHDLHGLEQKVQAYVAYRHQIQGPVIVYFSLIQTLQRFSSELRRLGLGHLVYHGQLGDRDRRRAQEAFLGSPGDAILATPAFGLGVDKPDVRMVMHGEVPGSLEAYYQEIGRAGRDGLPAECVLLYDEDDVSIQLDFLKRANPDPGFVQAVYNLIARNPDRARAEGFEFLRMQMNFYNSRDFRIETAVNLLERWGCLEGFRGPREWRAVQEPPIEYLDPAAHDGRLKSQQKKLLEMVQFAKSDGCRLQAIYRYFGFENASPCGSCDSCRRLQTPGAG